MVRCGGGRQAGRLLAGVVLHTNLVPSPVSLCRAFAGEQVLPLFAGQSIPGMQISNACPHYRTSYLSLFLRGPQKEKVQLIVLHIPPNISPIRYALLQLPLLQNQRPLLSHPSPPPCAGSATPTSGPAWVSSYQHSRRPPCTTPGPSSSRECGEGGWDNPWAFLKPWVWGGGLGQSLGVYNLSRAFPPLLSPRTPRPPLSSRALQVPLDYLARPGCHPAQYAHAHLAGGEPGVGEWRAWCW